MFTNFLYLITETPFILAYFLIIVLAEYLYTRRSTHIYSVKHSFINICVMGVGLIFITLFNNYIVHKAEILSVIGAHKIFDIPQNVLTFVLVLIVIDFLSFISHKWYHTYKLLWALHSVHHSDRYLDASTSLRVSFVTLLFPVLTYGLLTYIGIPLIIQIAVVQTMALHQFVTHSFLFRNVQFGWLSHIFVTPYFHAIHHEKNSYNTNYGFVFSIWDKMWNTVSNKKIDTMEFGLSFVKYTNNPVIIQMEPLNFYKK